MNNKKIIICVSALVIAIVIAIIVISVVVKNTEAKKETINNEIGVIIELEENNTPTININNNSSIREIDDETLSQYN